MEENRVDGDITEKYIEITDIDKSCCLNKLPVVFFSKERIWIRSSLLGIILAEDTSETNSKSVIGGEYEK
ncbi:MAG: hypothetical protein MRK01_12375 [Candidatus Scalindua sp.]|nr:hypothetical protein [Candidatus Scalindua sp.]